MEKIPPGVRVMAAATAPAVRRAAPAGSRSLPGAFAALLASAPAPRKPTAPIASGQRSTPQPSSLEPVAARVAPEGDERYAPAGNRRRTLPGEGDAHELDPLARALSCERATVALRATSSPAPVDAAAAAARTSLELVVAQIVRRIAWGGDGRSGTARVEIGAGALAGAVLLVHAEGGAVRVSLEVPMGVDAAAWGERLRSRLLARGLQVESVDVR